MSALQTWRDRARALAQRIDAMSLRERVFLFLCGAAVLLALVDTAWIAPLRAERDAQTAARLLQERELQQLRDQLSPPGGAQADATSPAMQLRQRIDTARAELASVQQTLVRGQRDATQSPDLAGLVGTLLKQHERLSLGRLSTIEGGPAAAQGVPIEHLRWQGVELQLSGAYRDQIEYLRHLERAVPGLHWGEMRLWSQGSSRSAVLQLQLFLLTPAP